MARVQAHTKELNARIGTLFENFENCRLKVCKSMMARNIGDVLLQLDNEHIADAEIWIKKAIEIDKRNGTRWYLATDHVLYADWHKRKGDLLSAKEELAKAIGIFAECGADGWVAKYERELAALS